MMRMQGCVAFVVAFAAVALCWCGARAEPCRAVWEGGYTTAGQNAEAALTRMEQGRAVLYTASAGASSAGVWRLGEHAWRQITGSIDGRVRAVMVVDERPWGGEGEAIYLGGQFTLGGSIVSVVRWDGAAWRPLVGGPSGEVAALAVANHGDGQRLYAAGAFVLVGNQISPTLGWWDGARWRAMERSPSGAIGAIATAPAAPGGTGERLFVAGSFGTIRLWTQSPYGTEWQFISGNAAFDGTSWSGTGAPAMGSAFVPTALATADVGAGPEVYAIADGGLHRYDESEGWSRLTDARERSPLLASRSTTGQSGVLHFIGGDRQVARFDGASVTVLGGSFSGPGPDWLGIADVDPGSPAFLLYLNGRGISLLTDRGWKQPLLGLLGGDFLGVMDYPEGPALTASSS